MLMPDRIVRPHGVASVRREGGSVGWLSRWVAGSVRFGGSVEDSVQIRFVAFMFRLLGALFLQLPISACDTNSSPRATAS